MDKPLTSEAFLGELRDRQEQLPLSLADGLELRTEIMIENSRLLRRLALNQQLGQILSIEHAVRGKCGSCQFRNRWKQVEHRDRLRHDAIAGQGLGPPGNCRHPQAALEGCPLT